MNCKSNILLITPPFVQLNAPYPATAYLTGYLRRKGYQVDQWDLSIELMNRIFSREFLRPIFDSIPMDSNDSILRMRLLRDKYMDTIDAVIDFLHQPDDSLAHLLCSPTFLPQGDSFQNIEDLNYNFGNLGTIECAKYLCSLYLQDISKLIRELISPDFELVRYGEHLALSLHDLSEIESRVTENPNPIEREMIDLLTDRIEKTTPQFIGFTVPFPGNLLSALQCAHYIKNHYPTCQIVFGGGYVSTELRNLNDSKIFKYVDYLILDDGEQPLEALLSDTPLIRTWRLLNTKIHWSDTPLPPLSHQERGCPDFSDFPHDKYLSIIEITNPMHRLWSDGRWNKIMLAHGCYWAKCAFCDTSLDYIRRFDSSVRAAEIVDWMCEIFRQTGSRGFHFVDEAAPPKLLKDIALELLSRKLHFTWWGNIRFESAYTEDLCRLLAEAGCIAVSGGLEVASDRLLMLMSKGVTIAQATVAMRNFNRAGIMVHTYLMYGFPTETLQETIDSLEVVRQMFRAELIDSAFWHRYAMTRHSPSGKNPEQFSVRCKNIGLHPFANNEIDFSENRNFNLETIGEGLRLSLFNYLNDNGLDKPISKWFSMKAPLPTIDSELISGYLLNPDDCRIYTPQRRIIWRGNDPIVSENGLQFSNNTTTKSVKLSQSQRDFVLKILPLCRDLKQTTTLSDLAEIYQQYSDESLLLFYHSKSWDKIREFGLMQI